MIIAWENQKAILKEKFKRLSEADLNFGENRKNEMLGKLALKLGMTTREIRGIIHPVVEGPPGKKDSEMDNREGFHAPGQKP